MNREEFMKELEYLLQDIPEEDKADALDYYRDYLEEAGDDAKTAIREFGSPERIAAIIRSDIAGHLEDGGEFTERGYEDERFRDPNYQVAERYDLPETAQSGSEGATWNQGRSSHEADWKEGQSDGGRTRGTGNAALKILLWVILLAVTSPIWLGIGTGVFGVLVGLVVTVVMLFAAAGIVAFAFLIGGIAAGVAGVVHLMVNPLGGMLAIGIGLLMLALSLVGIVICVQFYGRLIPWMIRGILDWLNRLFHRGRGNQ